MLLKYQSSSMGFYEIHNPYSKVKIPYTLAFYDILFYIIKSGKYANILIISENC